MNEPDPASLVHQLRHEKVMGEWVYNDRITPGTTQLARGPVIEGTLHITGGYDGGVLVYKQEAHARLIDGCRGIFYDGIYQKADGTELFLVNHQTGEFWVHPACFLSTPVLRVSYKRRFKIASLADCRVLVETAYRRRWKDSTWVIPSAANPK